MFLMYRNRLESNAEHWNALLLSLRELIEWVIRKDTELTGLGPIGGDVACLQKQQVRTMKHIKTCFVPRHMCVTLRPSVEKAARIVKYSFPFAMAYISV
jgi:hypothetical protein